ncbi:hypothetical protein [Amycolatopsis echigonensis]|uniref:Uncharacterized protein n=1 Tax=Amycolatopsis echigonensis TaxID=2576905 RepID=A0A8E1WAN9_9PSEU|nr:hypothetical protein [Amycolatopsis echigonensis]MBB2506480.1 hypothetical protein [Amycolatopsis echigonensis]
MTTGETRTARVTPARIALTVTATLLAALGLASSSTVLRTCFILVCVLRTPGRSSRASSISSAQLPQC